MDKLSTEFLRESAHDWSLDGDRKLLSQLKLVHKKVISNAADICTNLNESISSLDEANITLQNVNNRFTALSKTQFVESRVYEDDTDIRKEVTSSKISASVTSSDIPSITDLSHSLNVLESYHEPLLFDVDSDSENDEVTTHNEILELKDPYENSPLPHLIGSENWKTKSHVGIIEDSDHDVSESEDEISDSPEVDCSETTPKSSVYRESSDPLASWCENENESVPDTVATKPISQTDLATELARKLGGGAKPHELPVVPEEIKQQQNSSKLYKPMAHSQQAVIFFDTPPVLDPNDHSDSNESEPEDIFAEIDRSVPYNNKNKKYNHNTNKKDDDIFSDVGNNSGLVSENKPLRPDIDNDYSTIGNLKQESHKHTITEKQVKKPAGAISLFGSKHSAESIGAAIVGRNRKKSSSDEESNDFNYKSTSKNISEKGITESNVTKHIQVTNEIKIQEDVSNKPTPSSKTTNKPIADDILSSLLQPKTSKNEDKVTKSQESIYSPQSDVIKPKTNTTTKKIGWLDDDIFDDIDDIFTSQSKIVKVSKTNKEPIDKFDDDLFGSISKKPSQVDDDLFLNPAVKSADSKPKSADNLKSMFEQDKTVSKKCVDLFGDDNSILKEDDIFSVIKAPSKVSSVTKQKEEQIHEKNTMDNCNDKENQIVVKMIIKSNDEIHKNFENISPDNLRASTQNTLSSSLDTSDNSKIFNKDNENVIKNRSDRNAFENVGINDKNNILIRPENIIQKSDTHHIDYINRVSINAEEQVTSQPSHKEDLVHSKIDNITQQELNSPIVIPSEASENKIKVNPPSTITVENFLNDIINDVPPVLESDEPKKQKNINALFDDDFDDEELFFKKPVNISDEKPIISKEFEKPISVFLDEPPDFDVVDNIFHNSKSKEQNVTKTDDPIPQTSQTLEPNKVVVNKKNTESENNAVRKNKEQKVVGKLKQPNININVQTLLPGASMSKIKKEEVITKANTAPTEEITSNSDNKTTEKITSGVNKYTEQIIKTVSFDSESNTSILNNYMSKERPKIQVKRRPSTRRARIEASRNSTTDFPKTSNTDDDYYNNTHSDIDKPEPIVSKTVTQVNRKELYNTQILTINDQDTYIMKNPIQHKIISIDEQNKNIETPKQDNVITQNLITNVTDMVLTKNKKKTEKDLQQTSDENWNPLKSTVTSTASKPTHTEETKKSPNINKDKPQKSLFSDSSDDDLELFGRNTTKNKTKKKDTKSIFDDDDDDDALFTSKPKTKIKSRIDAKNKPLFSDDEDDSLFGPARDKK